MSRTAMSVDMPQSDRSELQIAVVDIGMNNLRSVTKALSKLNVSYTASAEIADLEKADRIILPGVGAFPEAMERLVSLKLFEPLTEQVIVNQKPILGICLGMQLFARNSAEGGFTNGLGFVDARVKKLASDASHRLPHISWNSVAQKKNCPLFNGLDDLCFMYFVHEYAVECYDQDLVAATSNYREDFVSVINQKNIYGVQFHPEKSHDAGAVLISNFIFTEAI